MPPPCSARAPRMACRALCRASWRNKSTAAGRSSAHYPLSEESMQALQTGRGLLRPFNFRRRRALKAAQIPVAGWAKDASPAAQCAFCTAPYTAGTATRQIVSRHACCGWAICRQGPAIDCSAKSWAVETVGKMPSGELQRFISQTDSTRRPDRASLKLPASARLRNALCVALQRREPRGEAVHTWA
jgi:hypothetical protein